MKKHQIRKWVFSFTTTLSVLITQAGLACTGLVCESGLVISGLEGATYTGIEDESVTLTNGSWEGPPYVEGGASRPNVGLARDVYFTGDLDADEQAETIAILWQNSGGTGSYIYIAAMKSENGEYENISTALLGDRVKLRSGKIDSGKIILEVLQAGENDPMCCPTQLATRTWTLQDNQLEESAMEVTGKLSLHILEESEWLLNGLNHEQPLPENIEVTLSIGEGRISGKSACNRYSAEIKEGDNPGDILIGPAMGTRMACPEPLMEVEQQYLERLAQVTSFSFHSGNLALNVQNEDGTPFSMLFSPAGMEGK